MADYASVLQGAQEDAVEVNQRALIDKVLARYSGESVVFRELLQNADDASASTVEIRFQSVGSPSLPGDSLPDLEKHLIGRIVARNDGIVFRDQDWARLRKIAEGNPDETKIGAFGVGFYSLWSLCEAPVVISGDTVMGFNWSERNPDQLVTRRGKNPSAGTDVAQSGKPWTSFIMDLREPAPMPTPHEFSRFLATSLAFTVAIRTIRLYFDDHLLCQLDKKLSPARPVRPGGHIGLSSPKRMMNIRSVDQTSLQIDAKVLPWILRKKARSKLVATTAKATASATTFAAKMLSAFSSSSSRTSSPSPAPTEVPHDDRTSRAELLHPTTASLFLRIVTANVGVSVSSSFSAELERATKKPPPRQTQYSLIWTSKDEWDASRGSSPSAASTAKVLSGDDSARSVFDGLISDLDAQGRVFIGFATHQTTGCAASVAARFIPTVERESLDLQASHVADWNKELLAVGGTLARIVYDAEIEEVGQLWKQKITGGKDDEATKQWLIGRCLHAMAFFAFLPSTPSSVVGAEAERQFFGCAPNSSFNVISTQGPQAAWKVRVPNPELSPFIKQMPFVPTSVGADPGHARFVERLKERRLVKDVTFDDVFGELNSRALSLDEMRACLAWFVGLAKMQGYDASLVSRLKSSAMVSFPSAAAGETTIMPLATARTFVNPKTLPTDLPLPLHTLPFELTKTFRVDELVHVFGFSELTVPDWLRRLVELSSSSSINPLPVEQNLTLSPAFAESVLNVVARAWGTMGGGQQQEVVGLLKDKTCVPTRHGMTKPDEAYHKNVNLFEDLSVVLMPSGKPVSGAMERLLTGLGVRKHVELQMVFSRLLGSGDWSHVELTRYLVSVRDTLSGDELDRLINTKWLPKAGEAKVPQPPGPDGKARRDRTVRYFARELFEPLDGLVALGLPVLEWPGRYRPSSDEGQLLASLGLKSRPSAEELLTIAATSKDISMRHRALAYFNDHYTSFYAATYRPGPTTPAFVTCRLSDGSSSLVRPTECYESPDAGVLGFPTVEEAFRADSIRYGVRSHPRPNDIMARLVGEGAVVRDATRARKVFAYLSTRAGDFSKTELASLKESPILPLVDKDGRVAMVKPDGCYFGGGSTGVSSYLKGLFTYVDFGEAAAPFLMAVGVKSQPTVQEIARMLVADPARFYRELGSPDAYIGLLRNVAANFELIGHGLRRDMQRSAFLLGTRRIAATTRTNGGGAGTGPAADSDDEGDTDDDENWGGGEEVVHRLATPKDLVIVDMATSFRPFAGIAWACVQEGVIEDLAEALGTPRVSSLIKDVFVSSGPVPAPNQIRIAEVRRLVVERSALFLHERHTTSKKEVRRDAEWLKGHLKVVQVSGLTLRRELRYGGTTHTYSRKASASVAMPSGGEMLLYISTGTELDWFEVAMGLCKVLLAKERPNDALMFNTILTTSLKNLKRRGMNIDRIINERKAEKAAAEQREREKKLQDELKAAEAGSRKEQMDTWESQLGEAFPGAQPGHVRKLLEDQQSDHLQRATEDLLKGYPTTQTPAVPPRPESMLSNDSSRSSSLFDTFKRRLRPNVAALPGPQSATSPLSPMSDANSTMIPQHPRPAVDPPKPGAQATPLSDIKSNLLKAVAASRPESNMDLHSKADTKYVRESESSYCDPVGHGTDMTFVTSLGGLRFYVSSQVPDGEEAARANAEAIRRYASQIIRPVGDVFDVDPRCLHVFLDREGPLIAFNRDGAIFFNLRYYLSWYDERVKKGDLADALIGTFSSLAHELAHNLVLPHNSEHEWWMSAFIEQYFLRLAVLIGKQQQQHQHQRSS